MPRTPMISPLYLTTDEQKVFAKVPEKVRKGAAVETETLMFKDTTEHLEARMRELKLQHPALKKLQQDAKKQKFTQEDIAKLSATIDLSDLSKDDLTELAFAWGPGVFTGMIAMILPAVTTTEDLADLGNLAGLRHGLLLALAQ